MGDEILYHRAALIGLWLARHGLMSGASMARDTAVPRDAAPAGTRVAGLRRSNDPSL